MTTHLDLVADEPESGFNTVSFEYWYCMHLEQTTVTVGNLYSIGMPYCGMNNHINYLVSSYVLHKVTVLTTKSYHSRGPLTLYTFNLYVVWLQLVRTCTLQVAITTAVTWDIVSLNYIIFKLIII